MFGARLPLELVSSVYITLGDKKVHDESVHVFFPKLDSV